MVDGVSHVEVDAAERLDLVRRLRIGSTPTVLVLGPDGGIAKRAAGLPRQADVIAALRCRRSRSAEGSDSPVEPRIASSAWLGSARTLTKRRAVDFCRVATAMCP